MTRAELEALSLIDLCIICDDKVMAWGRTGPGLDIYEYCARVRERIAELGRQKTFIARLRDSMDDVLMGEITWEILNSPPRLQIIAAILAVEGK